MSKFRFFGAFGTDKSSSKESPKTKGLPSTKKEDKPVKHTRTLTPVIHNQSLDYSALDSRSNGDLKAEGRSDSFEARRDNSGQSSDTRSCDIPFRGNDIITSKGVSEELYAKKLQKSNSKRSKMSALTKDQKLKNLEREIFEKDKIIGVLNEEISILTEKLAALEFSVKKKTHSETEKLKFRRLPDVSNDANPESLAGISASLVKYPKSAADRDFLIRSFSANELFVHIDDRQVKEMTECMYRIGVNNGESLTTDSDNLDTLFIISSGVFHIYKDGVRQASLFSGDCLGENMMLCKNSMKINCVAAADDCVVWALDRKIYKAIMLKSKMKLQSDYAYLLRQVPIFAQLPDTLILNIIGIIQELKFDKDEYIYRIGDLGTCFYIVKEGSVNIFRKINKQAMNPSLVKKLGRGSQFGENVLMIHERYNEDAKAGERGCTLLSIECDDFNNLLGFEEIGSDTGLIESITGPTKLSEHSSSSNVVSSLGSKQSSYFPATISAQNLESKSKKWHEPPRAMKEVEQDHNIKLEDLKSVCTVAHCNISQLEIAHMKNCPSNLFLLKQFKKKEIVDAGLQEKIMAEKKMLMSCHSPFIVRLHRTFKDRKYLYMLLEGCSGGDLASLLHDSSLFEDFHARFYVGCVIEALSFLHKHSIIFRSIKPESILIDDKGYAKVADLGNAKKISSSKKTYTFTGRSEYVAPELILNKGYDTSVDFWALGILIFELTAGHVPFKSSELMKTYNLILKGFDGFSFPASVSKNAIRLIRRLCRQCPTERIGYSKGSWSEVKKSRWFENFDWLKLSQKSLEPPIKPNVLDRIEILNDLFVKDDEIPPDETSGWDKDF